MAGATKLPAALADIVTCSLCCGLGYVRAGVRACVVHILWRGYCPHLRTIFFHHGLSPQGSSRIRHRVRRFGHCGSDRALGRVLHSLFTRVVVCWTGKCLSIA